MEYSERFSDGELAQIMEEGLIYMCACPAQVAETARKVRELYRYQINCIKDSGNDCTVHAAIAASAVLAHAELESCIEKILEIEKWDRATLQMPADLRKRQAEAISGEFP